MKDSMPSQYIPAQSSKATRSLTLFLILLSVPFLAAAQQAPTNTQPAGAQPSKTAPAPAAAPLKNQPTNAPGVAAPKSNDAAASPIADYKQSLKDLTALYEKDVQKLEQENTQAKELYHDGLISRLAMEASDKALADARAKVEETRKQLAAADKPMTAPLLPNLTNPFGASEQSWTTGNAKVDGLIRLYGNKYGVDAYLIFCLMNQESRFAASATSNKGAQGLMQLMPGTAARYGVTNPYDVAQSIMGGTRYLKDLLVMFNGRVDLALAGYNAGENAVIKYGYKVPPYQETRDYVRLISKRYELGRKTASTAATKPANSKTL
jgi:soluble lytic murein transglycosylase-like protein